MDGISVDENGTLCLTPFNMTLEIFNTETRRKTDAWETIYFHPNSSHENSFQSRNPTTLKSLQNYHNCIDTAMESFDELFNGEGLDFNYFPYAGKIWKVKLKFGIAFVIGDTELPDKWCGRYCNYNGNVNMLCRHCDCPTEFIVDPDFQKETNLIKSSDLDPENETILPGYFKMISHYAIKCFSFLRFWKQFI